MLSFFLFQLKICDYFKTNITDFITLAYSTDKRYKSALKNLNLLLLKLVQRAWIHKKLIRKDII